MAEPANVQLGRRAPPSRPNVAGANAIAPDGFGLAPDEAIPAAARRIAQTIAQPVADSVDREARFPAEAVAAMRSAGLLGAAVPRPLGGRGAPFSAIVAGCYELGQGCANAAMVFAMHQIQVASLVRHSAESAWHRDFLARLVQEQLLIASATTEAGSGGDVRRSECAVQGQRDRVSVTKAGCVISYAEQADAVLVTARRAAESDPGDQVAVLAERHQCTLELVASWDTLGMRGTCSRSYALKLESDRAQIVPDPYATMATQTMLPVSHITWAALWLGIATAACQRARRVVRRRAVPGGAAPTGSLRIAQALAQLQSLRAQVADAARRFEAAGSDVDVLHSIPFALAMNQLKLTVSSGVVQVIGDAMLAAGLAGYRNDSADSLGRHLRDAYSAALMIGNDRIMANCAALVSGYRGEEELFV